MRNLNFWRDRLSADQLFAETTGCFKLMPVEMQALAVFAGVWVIGVACGLPISVPDVVSIQYIQQGFLVPLLCASLLQILIAIFTGWHNLRQQRSDPFLMLKLLPVMVVTIFIYFNLKAWMPLVNPRMYDEVYQSIDLSLWPLVKLFSDARAAIVDGFESYTSLSIDFAYLQLYLIMFFLSPCIHGLVDAPRRQRQVVFGACLIMLVGGISYWIAPAAGPFLYRQGLNIEGLSAQQYMYGLFLQVRNTGHIPTGYFSAPIAAMPSLHVAHALFFTLCAARSARVLLIFYLPILFWITIESVASGWHYLIDLPAGALLAVLCLYLVIRWLPEVDKHRSSTSSTNNL
ncbi:MAG: phosphatase PAP2 family protein [Pyrinomonadaceae bacterium]